MTQVYGWLTLDELKQAAAMERLAALEGNQTKTAESLKISRTTLASIISEFEKRSSEDKERIQLNNEKLRQMTNQDSKTFVVDINTGMSVPLAPAPLKPVQLFKAPEPEKDPLSQAAVTLANASRAPNNFNPITKATTPIKLKTQLETEAEKEHARFAKLDKTPFSTKQAAETKANEEKAKVEKKPKKAKAG